MRAGARLDGHLPLLCGWAVWSRLKGVLRAVLKRSRFASSWATRLPLNRASLAASGCNGWRLAQGARRVQDFFRPLNMPEPWMALRTGLEAGESNGPQLAARSRRRGSDQVTKWTTARTSPLLGGQPHQKPRQNHRRCESSGPHLDWPSPLLVYLAVRSRMSWYR